MIRFQFHLQIPDLGPAESHLDPRQRNHQDNAETRRNISCNLSRHVLLTVISLYNWVNRGTAWDAWIYWLWKNFCVESVRAWGETLIEKFQDQHVAYPNLFNTCRKFGRYDECRPLFLKPFITWRPAQGGKEQMYWPWSCLPKAPGGRGSDCGGCGSKYWNLKASGCTGVVLNLVI